MEAKQKINNNKKLSKGLEPIQADGDSGPELGFCVLKSRSLMNCSKQSMTLEFQTRALLLNLALSKPQLTQVELLVV